MGVVHHGPLTPDMHVLRAADAPAREGLTWTERWKGPDEGLVAAWEAGRELAPRRPNLVAATRAGQLIELPWKGGLTRALKGDAPKFGTLLYVAMWRGLRGDALDIATDAEIVLTCTRFGTTVTFTAEATKYVEAEPTR